LTALLLAGIESARYWQLGENHRKSYFPAGMLSDLTSSPVAVLRMLKHARDALFSPSAVILVQEKKSACCPA